MKGKIIIGTIAFLLIVGTAIYFVGHDNNNSRSSTESYDNVHVPTYVKDNWGFAVDDNDPGIPADALVVEVSKTIDAVTLILNDESIIYTLAGIELGKSNLSDDIEGNVKDSQIADNAHDFTDLMIEYTKIYGTFERTKTNQDVVYLWGANGLLINLQLLRQGMAVVDMETINDKYKDIFIDAEAYAKKEKTGLWSNS